MRFVQVSYFLIPRSLLSGIHLILLNFIRISFLYKPNFVGFLYFWDVVDLTPRIPKSNEVGRFFFVVKMNRISIANIEESSRESYIPILQGVHWHKRFLCEWPSLPVCSRYNSRLRGTRRPASLFFIALIFFEPNLELKHGN